LKFFVLSHLRSNSAHGKEYRRFTMSDPYNGQSTNPNVPGISGENTAESGTGVLGHSQTGRGVWGTTESGTAVVGDTTSGTGVFGHSHTGTGVAGLSEGNIGDTLGNGTGVLGHSQTGRGVWGTTESGTAVAGDTTIGIGVIGHSQNNTGVYGISESFIGVSGESTGGTGVRAISRSGIGLVASSDSGIAGLFEGKVTVTVLEIVGGADLAEPFVVENHTEVEPGTVMVIDENSQGQLRISDTAYDRKVAGIVSGAGGLKPGLKLQQEHVAQGDVHMALAGRVYCKAEATSSPIEPGDLLTTSHIPGYAMRVTDEQLSRGAVLGKAMSSLKKDRGLVLVLVNLQ
jgi:hypothetical protein